LTVTVCPATVSVVLRAAADVLAGTVTVTDPSPDPLAGDTVAQPALDEAVQVQPACAAIVTVALSPPASTDIDAGDTA
jgi:hypothetical protein